MDNRINNSEITEAFGATAKTAVTERMPGGSAQKRKKKKKKKDKAGTIFFATMIALPLLQFIIFYIVVNFNSIVLAFQKYSISDTAFQPASEFSSVFCPECVCRHAAQPSVRLLHLQADAHARDLQGDAVFTERHL